MIPDFPRQKAKLMELMNKYFENRKRSHLGYLATIPTFTSHEGDSWSIENADGTTKEVGYTGIETIMTISHDELRTMTVEDIMKRIDGAAQDMARQQSEKFFAVINRMTEESGRSFDAKGQRLSKDLLLKLLDSIEWSFNEKGEIRGTAILTDSHTFDAYKDELKAWEQDPEFKKQFDKIAEQKREAWRDRESNRKLVD